VVVGSSCLDFFHLSFAETIWGFVQVCGYTSPLYVIPHVAWMDFSWVLQNQPLCKRWDFGSKTSLSFLWGYCGKDLLLSGRI